MFADDVAIIATNFPLTAAQALDPEDPLLAPRGGPQLTRTRCQGEGRAGGIHVAVLGGMEGGEHATDYSSWFLWPTFSFQVYPGNVLNTYLWRAVKVAGTRVYRGWYNVDGARSEVVARLAQQDLSTTVTEDIRLVNSVQQGLASLGYRPGPLVIDPDQGVNSEHSIRAIHEWVLAAHE